MGGWWVAWSNLVSAQGPLVLGLGLRGLGLRVWGQGLTKVKLRWYKYKALALRWTGPTTP